MKNRMSVPVIILSLILLFVAVRAQQPDPPAGNLPPVETTAPVESYLGAVGVGAVIMVLVEVLKHLKVVPDGQAGLYATVANVVTFAGLTVAGVFGFDVTGNVAQDVLKILEQAGNLVLMIVSSPLVFGMLRQANVLKKKKPIF